MIYDCIIVGAGPAGVAAAMQLQRLGISPVIVECRRIGGCLWNARRIENYAGWPRGVTGEGFARALAQQLTLRHLRVLRECALTIRRAGKVIVVRTDRGVLRAQSVIVATGTQPKTARIPGEAAAARRKRLFYDQQSIVGPRGRRVLVIGGGDIACDYALALRDRGHQPLLLARSALRCNAALTREIRARHIARRMRVTFRAIRCDARGVAVVYVNGESRGDVVVVAVGRAPDLPSGARHTRGVFIAGDVRGGRSRQTQIAAGDGVRAALRLADYLRRIT